MKYLFITVFLLSGRIALAQHREVVKLSGFSQVKASGNLHLILKEGEVNQALVEYNDIDFDDILLDVTDNTLKVSIRPIFHGNIFVRITVEYKSIRKIQASASARVDVNDILDNEFNELNSSSGAEINVSVDAKEFEMKATSGGKINIQGSSTSVECISATGALINARRLSTRNAYVKANSGGTVEIKVSGQLEASVATGGTINYIGNPEKVSIDKTLGGSVNQL